MQGKLLLRVSLRLGACREVLKLPEERADTPHSSIPVREKEYVEAARAIGISGLRLIFRHVFPNVLGPAIVAQALQIPGFILYEAFLSFIGLGVNPPTPSWGMMLSKGYVGMRSHFHLVLWPAVAISITLFAFNFLGDGVRDAFDPKQTR